MGNISSIALLVIVMHSMARKLAMYPATTVRKCMKYDDGNLSLQNVAQSANTKNFIFRTFQSNYFDWLIFYSSLLHGVKKMASVSKLITET